MSLDQQRSDQILMNDKPDLEVGGKAGSQVQCRADLAVGAAVFVARFIHLVEKAKSERTGHQHQDQGGPVTQAHAVRHSEDFVGHESEILILSVNFCQVTNPEQPGPKMISQRWLEPTQNPFIG